ncbi:stretch-activated cation channel Mid1 [Flagelloscypha sp. PMI_526]|nr:stretch-activated cation channel Mid1 [Flagelloscypha sp. PMI_526]
MLPEALLSLLWAALAAAQQRTTLPLNAVTPVSPTTNTPAFNLPVSSSLDITITLCPDPGTSPPRFFVNNASTGVTPSSSGGDNVFEIPLLTGFGNWTGLFPQGGSLAVENVGQTAFEIGVSDSGPLHESLAIPPLLGDTTSNQALLFSAPFGTLDTTKPSWPNYTLPSANLTQQPPPSNIGNYTVFIETTSSATDAALRPPACVLRKRQSLGRVANTTVWQRDWAGWRTQWMIEGLTASTNYTAYVIVDNNKVSGPIHFTTKSASFSCPLVTGLSFCPTASYAMPLPPPPPPATFYNGNNFPAAISKTILSGLTNFTTSLQTFACGRDEYSPLVSCDDCQREYRQWLCTALLTRCGEPSPSSPDAFTSPVPSPTQTGIAVNDNGDSDNDDNAPQKVFSALVPMSSGSPQRNQDFPPMSTDYRVLLPCLETCTAVQRACPYFMGFKCPLRRFNAHASYGVGYVDSGKDGVEGGGAVARAQDLYGNVWCNA